MAIALSQRTALVTGSSRGIGRGIALKLAEAGVKRIAINYVENDGAAREAAQLVQERGAETLLLKANVGDVGQLKAMFARVKETWDSLDIYVSNARASLATGFYAVPMEITLEQWHATVDTQATEFLVACREAVPMMGKSGRIIAITYAPGSATGSWQPWVAMGSAKAAKESLVRYFAVALAQSGWTPMRRLGTPADIGNAVVLMCTEQAGFITGQTLHVDGGGSAMLPDFPLGIQGIK